MPSNPRPETAARETLAKISNIAWKGYQSSPHCREIYALLRDNVEPLIAALSASPATGEAVEGATVFCVGPDGVHASPAGPEMQPVVEELLRRMAAATGEAGGCINCGAKGEGGYETEEVGPFCGQCWGFLQERFAPPRGRRTLMADEHPAVREARACLTLPIGAEVFPTAALAERDYRLRNALTVLLAHLAQVEREKAEAQAIGADLGAIGYDLSGELHDLKARAEAAEAEAARLREALAEFADLENWVCAIGPMGGSIDGWCGVQSPWKRVQEALDTPGPRQE